MKRIQQVSLSLFLLLCLLLSACGAVPGGTQTSFSLEDVPAFSGEPYVVLSDNQPGFTQEELDQAAQGFEEYSPWIPWAGAARPMPAWGWTPCSPRTGSPSAV